MIGINNHTKSINDREWIEVKGKSRKVRFMKQDQFGAKEFPLTLYRQPSFHALIWFLLLSSNFGSTFSLSKWQSIEGL
jgi:hypothetical protein